MLLDMYETVRSYERTAARLKEDQARARLKEKDDKFKQAMKKFQMAAIELRGYVEFQQLKQQRFNDETIFELYDKIKGAAMKFADEQGYDIILVNDSVVEIPENTDNILAQISSRRVLFARQQMDVTDQLIQAMNSEYQQSTAAN